MLIFLLRSICYELDFYILLFKMQKVLAIFEKHCFVKSIQNNNGLKYFKFGPAGQLMKNNIHNEWTLSTVINSETSVYPYNSGERKQCGAYEALKESVVEVQKLNSEFLPFGISMNQNEPNCSSLTGEINNFLCNTQAQKYLRTFMFVSPKTSTQFFYLFQRQRKMWWKKFSACPGRFILCDNQDDEQNQAVSVTAEFEWGSQIVEAIWLREIFTKNSISPEEMHLFEFRDGRRKTMPHVVESVTSLEVALFTFLCDAYDESKLLGVPREVLRLHRKLAPYKISFAASCQNASVGEELSQLAHYLAKKIRGRGISTLLLPDLAKKTLESQFLRNDELGIPYTVVINDSTLKNGIVGLRSRDTTLKEQVHMTKLQEYVEEIMASY